MKRLAWFYVGFIVQLMAWIQGNTLAGIIGRYDANPDPYLAALAVIFGLFTLTCTVMSALCFSQALYQPRR